MGSGAATLFYDLGTFRSTYAFSAERALIDPPLDSLYYYTVPMVHTVTSGLVNRSRTDAGIFRLYDPFTFDLWVAVIVSTFVVAFLILLVDIILHGKLSLDLEKGLDLKGEMRQDDQGRYSREPRLKVLARQYAQTAYLSWATLLGGEEEYHWATWPSRLLRLALLKIVLVVVATYTANLAAFFNAPTEKIGGPMSNDDLSRQVACVYDVNNLPYIRRFVSRVITPPQDSTDISDLDAVYQRQSGMDYCHQALSDGRADIMMGSRPELGSYLYEGGRCNVLGIADFIAIQPIDASFVFRVSDTEFARNVSRAIVRLLNSTEYPALLRDELYQGRTCPSTDSSDSETEPVSFVAMGGLFVVSGSLCGLAVLWALALRVLTGCDGNTPRNRQRTLGSLSADSPLDHTATEGQVLRAILAKVERMEGSDHDQGTLSRHEETLKALVSKVDLLSRAVLSQDKQGAGFRDGSLELQGGSSRLDRLKASKTGAKIVLTSDV